MPEQLVLDLKAKKHLLPFNLGVTETRIGCINHDLEDGRNQPNYDKILEHYLVLEKLL